LCGEDYIIFGQRKRLKGYHYQPSNSKAAFLSVAEFRALPYLWLFFDQKNRSISETRKNGIYVFSLDA